MIVFSAFLLGGVFGILLWLYVSGFIERLQHDIYDNYVELFPQNPPSFQPHFATIQTKKSGHFFAYFVISGLILSILNTITDDAMLALWLHSTLTLLWAIAYLDGQYQLISPTPCLWLTALGLFGASQSFSVLTLEESLQSAVGFFLVFYNIYWLAKWYYKTEAFGQGDYWLALGLGSYLPLERLPLFLLVACLLGISFAVIFKKKHNFLPFAPFLCSAILVVLPADYFL